MIYRDFSKYAKTCQHLPANIFNTDKGIDFINREHKFKKLEYQNIFVLLIGLKLVLHGNIHECVSLDPRSPRTIDLKACACNQE